MTSKKPKTRHKSVRLEIESFVVVQSVADVLFNGNFSKALNFLFRMMRKNKEFGHILYLITMRAEFDRGYRTKEVIDGAKKLDVLLAQITK